MIEPMAPAEMTDKEFDRRFHAVVESLADAVVSIDDRAVIEFLNPAGERIFGYSRQQLLGKSANLLIPEWDARFSGIGREVVGQRADGSRFPLEATISEVTTTGRRCFIGVLHDLTERRRLEQQLITARQAAATVNEAKTTFLRKLGHELRTPLTPIMGYAELLLDEALTEDQHEAASAIMRNAELLQSQLSRLLATVNDDEMEIAESSSARLNPHAMNESPPITAVPAPKFSVVSHTARVLVAVDCEENQRLLQQMLAHRGIQPSLVASGRAAVSEAILAANSGCPYDLILMDMQMPELNGWEACGKLRSAKLQTPIIAITALSLPNDLVNCLDSGCQEVLKKPLKFNQLADVLDRWLPGHSKSDSSIPAVDREFSK